MTTRVKLLAGLAVIGLAAALIFGRGGVPGVALPLRSSAGGKGPAASPAPAADTASGYAKFRLVHTRNVFDPDRRPVRPATAEPVATPPPARTDFVALTGTMFDAGKSLAFFSGSRAEYNKVLSVSDRIAGAAITQITPANIEIERDGKKSVVAIGQTVPFDGGSAPAAAPAPDAFAAAPATTGAAAGNTAPPSPNAPSANKADDVRRRMEERRRQEQK